MTLHALHISITLLVKEPGSDFGFVYCPLRINTKAGPTYGAKNALHLYASFVIWMTSIGDIIQETDGTGYFIKINPTTTCNIDNGL